MRYQKLGNTDIDVSVIALGTWGLGGGSVWTDRDSTVEDTRNLLDICREYGVNYIDTARFTAQVQARSCSAGH